MYSLGIDYGTNSVRAVLVELKTGEEVAFSVANYPSGRDGIILDPKDPNCARQNPADYLVSLEKVVRGVISAARKNKTFSPEKVIGIGVDTTGSTPIPVDGNLAPLSFHKQLKNNRNALAWLWKDHTSSDEAEEITALARKMRPQYLAKIGGVYSSEWFFSKILRLSRIDKKVFNAAASFVEFADYIPAVLAGKNRPGDVLRGICAAGHKAMYNEEWKGLPDEKFLGALNPAFKGLRAKLYERAYPAGVPAGCLCAAWAKKLGLPEGIPISIGAFDAHMGAVGSGIKERTLVKILGTSTCDMMIFPETKKLPDIPGLCGIVPDSIVPGYYGLEAGQSAVGDIFYWFVKTFMAGCEGSYTRYENLAKRLKPGQSGLLALDWHNGNRTVLVDQKLTGLMLGFTLHTKPEEAYRALIEATAFGARAIVERLEEYGVEVDDIITGGGIAEKSPFLMQIYADITRREYRLSASSQNCAVGAAIFGAMAAGKEKSGFDGVAAAQRKICRFKKAVYKPASTSRRTYDRLFGLYKKLHDSFGTRAYSENLFCVMKELLKIKDEVVNG